MPIVDYVIAIEGKEQTLKVETDPPWGQIQGLLSGASIPDGKGGNKVDMMVFLDRLLEIVIVGSDGDFQIKNRTYVKQLPTSVMTKLIGGVTKLIPLQEYLDNMESLEKLSNQQ